MFKQTQTICWLLPKNCLSGIDHLVRFSLKGIKLNKKLSVNQTNFSKFEKHLRVYRLVFWEGKNQNKRKQIGSTSFPRDNLTQEIYFT